MSNNDIAAFGRLFLCRIRCNIDPRMTRGSSEPVACHGQRRHGTDNWGVVSTVRGSLQSIGPFAESEQLRTLRAGEARITSLMRHEGESWSRAVRVLLSPIVFSNPFEIGQKPLELIEAVIPSIARRKPLIPHDPIACRQCNLIE
jgi:hypothetical protein